MGRVIRTGQAALCEDINQSPFVIHGREALITAGVRSLACLPLRVDGTPVGSFLCGTMTSGVIGAGGNAAARRGRLQSVVRAAVPG